MSDIAVRVQNLGKCYQIGQAKSGEFRESFNGWMDKLRGRSNGKVAESKDFWALKDINFEIKKGEAVGIIGRNGAGKSTLLKILSRITEPTKGRFEINGRVSSLLEVGTGFHPELSGRENIYLNGTILGMKRKEIKAKFDEILAFSGVEKFIDTPVKHYSSGMKVRLAFSVAAHLEPEILIIDEVLAVGDAEFQKKCLGKMDEVSRNEGRTVVFVSHNMGAIESLCSKGILLENGTCCFQGSIDTCIKTYLTDKSVKLGPTNQVVNIKLNSEVQILEFCFDKNVVKTFDDVSFKLVIKSEVKNLYSGIALLFYSKRQERVAIVDIRSEEFTENSLKSNVLTVAGKVFSLPFIEGDYEIGLYISSNLCTGNFNNLLSLSLMAPTTAVAPYPTKVRGYVNLKNEYSIYE